VSASDRPCAERDAGREREKHASCHGPPAPDLPPPLLAVAFAGPSVRIGIGHQKGRQA
jgi:hypothetical protein